MESGKCCFIFILLIFCAIVLIAGGTNADAAGSISGKVTREGTTDPIAGLRVYPWDLNSNTWVKDQNSKIVYGQTGADGTYTISGLAPGQYKVYAYSSETYYLSEWYDNTYDFGTAATVTVNDGQTTQNIDYSLTLGGLIYGKVTPYSITGLNVYAYNINTSTWTGSASPQTDGTYVIALPPGQYKVYAEASGTNYASEWYYNAYFASATMVNVLAGKTTLGINFTMSLGGRISGKVTNEGAAVAGLTISAYDFSSDSWAGEAKTKADGTYTISGLAPGQYRVYANTSGTDYASAWYDNALYESAIPLNVQAGQATQSINFNLARGGGVSGKVTKDGTTDAIPGLQVSAIDLGSGFWAGSAETDADGTYAISGLVPGQYRVYADASGTIFVSEYYNNVLDYDSAATVNITAGQTIPNVDFGLAPGDSISGKVTKAGTADAIGNLPVYAYDFNSDEWAGEARTQTDGTYAISGLAPGQYRVYAFASARNYVSEWYDNTTDYDTATPVTVTAGQQTQNIDFGLAAGGSISGTVALDGTAGYPPPGLVVYAFDALTNEWAGSAQTQTDGTYVIYGLAPGQYRVQISSSGTHYMSEWYNNVALREAATPVTVQAGQTTLNINFAVTIYPLTTVTSTPEGLQVMVDGKAYTTPQTFGWKPGSAHTIGVSSPQTEAGDSGTQHEFHRWSDGKAQTHAVTAADIPFIYMASFGRMIGDLDGSRTVDIRDAILALQVVAGMEPSKVSKAASLVYGDKIGIREAIYILQKAAGLR